MVRERRFLASAPHRSEHQRLRLVAFAGSRRRQPSRAHSRGAATGSMVNSGPQIAQASPQCPGRILTRAGRVQRTSTGAALAHVSRHGAGSVDRLKIEQEPRPGIYPFDYGKLQGYVGRCYTTLGLHKAAVPALREALDGMPTSKYRAVLLLDLAQSLDGDEARELVAEARRIGTQQQSRKVLTRT